MKLLIVDDHRMMRDGLKAILEKEGVVVVAEASSGREAIELARSVRPEIVLMDVSMPDLNGVDATRRLVAEIPGVKVIGLSMNADRRYVVAMFKAGASGYLIKNAASQELIQAVRTVEANLKYVSPSIASIILDDLVDGAVPPKATTARPLSPREREVLQLLAEGKSSKDIASKLEVALPTVETHRRQIMDKVGLRTTAELTKFAIREGLTSLE